MTNIYKYGFLSVCVTTALSTVSRKRKDTGANWKNKGEAIMKDNMPTEVCNMPNMSGITVNGLQFVKFSDVEEYLKNHHVIKKSDGGISSKDSIGGDVMEALELLNKSEVISRGGRYVAVKITDADKIKEALIAQSRSETRDKPDPDMVTIPRKVLEKMRDEYAKNTEFGGAARHAYNEVLNYKEGE